MKMATSNANPIAIMFSGMAKTTTSLKMSGAYNLMSYMHVDIIIKLLYEHMALVVSPVPQAMG